MTKPAKKKDSKGKTSQDRARELAQRTAIEERQQAVFCYWRDNPLIGWRAVAAHFKDTFDISHETARTDVHAVLTRNLAEFHTNEVDPWKEKQITRLEHLLTLLEELLGNLSGTDRIAVIREARQVIREINDITGVRAAVKVEHSGTIGFNWSEITADAANGTNLTNDGD